VLVTKAVTEGYATFRAIGIISDSKQFTSPCGICPPVGYLIKHSRICGICPDLHVLRQWRLRDEDFRSAPTAIIRSNIVAEGVRQSTLGHLSEFMQLGWLIVRVKAFNNLNEIRHSWTPFEFEIFGIYPAFLRLL